MSKFKVGDRVRTIVDDIVDGWKKGAEFVVYPSPSDGTPIILDRGRRERDINDSINSSDFELISEDQPAPAIDAHYTKYAIQPMEFSLANGLDAAQHTVIKYVVRYRDKGGVRDLRAAIRVLELMIEREEKANG